MLKDLNILFVTNSEEVTQLTNELGKLKEFKIHLKSTPLESAWDVIVESKPNVLVLAAEDRPDEYLDLIRRTKTYYHGVHIIVLSNNTDSEFILEADLVVIGINAQPEDGLLHALQGKIKEVIAVGDAAAPGNLGAALRNATEIALKI